MRVLIVGGSGVIGSRLANLMRDAGYQVFYTYFNNPFSIDGCEPYRLDIINREDTINLIKKIKPDITIHTSSVPSVDLCETNQILAKEVNINGTKNIVDGCKFVNSKIVFFSTAFVFDGKKKLYFENDQPNPINYYGFTKLEGEKIVSSSGLHFVIARTDQLYGWINKGQKENSVIRVLKKLESGETAKEFMDWYNNPTLVDNCAEVIFELIKKNKVGIYHTVGSDYVNRYDWTLKIAEVFDKDKSLIIPIKSEELKLPAKRPNCNLSNTKAQVDSDKKLFGIENGLKFMLKQLKKGIFGL
jgi:dTDP-4-dehydrorhamnose reductase